MRNLIAISGKSGSGKDLVGAIIQYLVGGEDNEKVMSIQEFLEHYTLSITKTGGWEIKKFADKLKEITCLLLGCTREQLENQEFKATELPEQWWYWKLQHEGGYGTTLIPYNSSLDAYAVDGYELVKTTPRLFLQLLGTECGRNILHPHLWANSLFTNYMCPCDLFNSKPKHKGDWTSCMQCEGPPNWIITDCRFPNEAQSVKERGGIIIRINRNKTVGFLKDLEEGCIVIPYDEYLNKKYDSEYYWSYGKLKPIHPNTSNHSSDQKFKMISSPKSNYGEHASETGLDNYKGFDYIIENNGSIKELIEKVREILIKEELLK